MAAGDVSLGNAVAVAHTSGVTMAKILSWSHSMPERTTVDASDCSTTGPKPFLAAPDYDMGTVSVTLRFNDTINPATALAATGATALAFTFPNGGGFTCDAWMTSVSSQGAKDQIIDATFTFKLNGTNITW